MRYFIIFSKGILRFAKQNRGYIALLTMSFPDFVTF
jgi:hypothetical protein